MVGDIDDGDRVYLSVWKAGLRILDVSMLSNGTIVPDVDGELDIASQMIAPGSGSAFFKLAQVDVPSGAKRLMVTQGLDGVRIFRENSAGLVADDPNDPFDAGVGFAGDLTGEECCYAWNVHGAGDGRAYIAFGDLAVPHTGGFQSVVFSSDPDGASR